MNKFHHAQLHNKVYKSLGNKYLSQSQCIYKVSDKPKRSAYKRPTLHTQTVIQPGKKEY